MPIISVAMALAQFVPSLLSMFGAGQPTVEAATKVVGIAQAVTGAHTPEEALAALQADSAKQAEFNLAVLKQDGDIRLALITDVQNARARDVALNANGAKNLRGDILAYIAIGSLVTVMYIALFRDIPAGPGRDLILILAGTLVAVVKDVYNFEFGSTRVNKTKDDTINNLTK